MRALVVAAVASLLLAAAVRLPGLGERGLASEEQAAFAESQGFSTRAALPTGRPLAAEALPRHGTAPSVGAAGLALWVRLAGASETALRLPSALAGVLAAVLVALVAGRLAGPRAAAWAGGLVALSPIHTLASRQVGSEAPLVLVLVLALALLARVEEWESRPSATALVVVAGAALLGLARPPPDFGDISSWAPETTASGIARCAGASFTRVAGIEYHLVVSHARYVIPLTALFVGLMAWGAVQLPRRVRQLLLAGTALPFLLGVALALATGRVTPLQATRLLAALPFVALLMAAGLASLRGWRAWAAGTAVAGTVVAFLALALARPAHGTSPTQAVAREVARCGAGVVAVQRPLDLRTLAAWGVPGPFVLRTPGAPLPAGPAIVVGPSPACVTGGATCAPFPACPAD